MLSLKSTEQTSWLEIQAVADAVVLKQNFFSRKPQFSLLKFSTDWIRPIYIIEGNLLT